MREHIRESNWIEGIDDPTADAVGEAAWAWLTRHDTLTVEVILTLHRITTAAQPSLRADERGAWRTIGVMVGGRVCPPADQVPGLMTGWLDRWATGPLAGDEPRQAHVEFEHIHPFVDGNGRVGRLVLFWHQVLAGEDPTLLRASERHDYYKWFQ